MNENSIQTKPHNVIIDNRRKMELTGVRDVSGFDEQTVSLITEMGGLVIKGTGLHITRLSLDTGDVTVEGNVNAMQYTTAGTPSKGLVSKLFR